MDDIVAALNAQGVAQAEVNEAIAILYSLKGNVLRVRQVRGDIPWLKRSAASSC